MTTKYCRWCRQGYRDVNWNDFFVDAGRAHFITGSAGVMTGDRKPDVNEKLATIDLDEFLQTEPEQLPEIIPGEETNDRLVQ